MDERRRALARHIINAAQVVGIQLSESKYISNLLANLSQQIRALSGVELFVLDEVHLGFAKLTPVETIDFGRLIKTLATSRPECDIYTVLAESSQILLWSCLDRIPENGVSIFFESISFTTSFTSEEEHLIELFNLLNKGYYFGAKRPSLEEWKDFLCLLPKISSAIDPRILERLVKPPGENQKIPFQDPLLDAFVHQENHQSFWLSCLWRRAMAAVEEGEDWRFIEVIELIIAAWQPSSSLFDEINPSDLVWTAAVDLSPSFTEST